MVGCAENCSETSLQDTLTTIPIVGVDPRRKQVILDISAMGEGLTLDQVVPPSFFGLEEVDTRAVFVEYSKATLIFDVKNELKPLLPDGTIDPDADSVFATTRWYLLQSSVFDDAFLAREPIDEVGYFTTFRSAVPKIGRFSTTRYGSQAPVHYYIKNVPTEWKPAFDEALDDWNDVFSAQLGYDLISYEHIPENSPLNRYVVAGDPRFNVIEWDLDNRAFYGGFGPSIGHQFTGQTIAGISMIQGPSIIELYSDWFDVNTQAAQLRAAGQPAQAAKVIAAWQRSLATRLPESPLAGAQVRVGNLKMVLPAADPQLTDAMMNPFDFDETPPGVTFEQYMHGYFVEIVAHEIGHNLGLRHNFMGSLSGNGAGLSSHSVMEYVVRTQRYLNQVGAYDAQATAYGYTGVVPANPLPYCTDFERPDFDPALSAECSFNDAGPDAFASLRDARVVRAVDLAIGRDLGAAPPEWTVPELQGQLYTGLSGMIFYATSAATADSWVNWTVDASRPTDPSLIPGYVTTQIETTICNPSIAQAIVDKHTLDPAAGLAAKAQWREVLDFADLIGGFFAFPLSPCSEIEALPF